VLRRAASTTAYSITRKKVPTNVELQISLLPTLEKGTSRADVAMATICTLLAFTALAEFTGQ
jgi:hypothetical protein